MYSRIGIYGQVTFCSMSAPSFLRPRHIHRNRCKSSGGASKLWIIPSGGDYSIFKVQRAFADFLFLPCVILSLLSVGLLSYIPFRLPRSIEFQCLLKVCPSSQGRKSNLWGVIVYFLGLLFSGIYGRILKNRIFKSYHAPRTRVTCRSPAPWDTHIISRNFLIVFP